MNEANCHEIIEDKIKNVYGQILELQSLINIIKCAVFNEFNPPETVDISNTIDIMSKHIKNIVVDTQKFMNYCIENDLW